MFYIFTSTPEGDHMALYERAELDEIFGEYNATQLEAGISVFANGGIHINAAHAAMREAGDILMNGETA